MASNASPFSLRPWPVGDKKPKTLAEFIARVNAQPGGFRSIDEAKLRAQIREEEEDAMDVDGEQGSSDSEEEADTDSSRGIIATREEVLKNIEVAHQSALLGLDFVSLLLSKEAPVQASTTLSPALRDLVGIGTLGASKLHQSNVTPAQTQDDIAVATGWRIMGNTGMMDSVLASAQRLEKEMELETKYWADVLAVSDDGWAVCSLPQDPHTLGVRFGFSESAAEFRNNSIAPLRRKDDGTSQLALSRVGGGSQRVRVTLKKDGKVVDQSPLPGRISDDAPIQDRVREARDTVYHQELWYELNREARTLVAVNVSHEGSAIVWKRDEHRWLYFTLEDLAEPDEAHVDYSSASCSCISSWHYLQFLFFQGHRQNYHRRTNLSPSPPQWVVANQPYSIIRPLIARLKYMEEDTRMNNFLGSLVSAMRRAGISTASYSSSISDTDHSLSQRSNAKTEIQWVNQLVGQLTSSYVLDITPELRIWTQARIITVPYIGMQYTITLRPPSAEPENGPPRNPLQQLYPPVDPPEGYPNTDEAIYYLRSAATRAVAHEIAGRVARKLGREDGAGAGWRGSVDGASMTNAETDEGRVDLSTVDGALVLSAEARCGGDGDGETAPRRSWTWRADDAGDPPHGSLEDVFLQIMKGEV
ncbi:subunit 17 of mediator complex-domain-containing protein [Xylariaceae sp. FL0804]|nr:subunit 17 of mediator complex-domain-containing protein [Xylariaceae sp. FL0804]